MNRKKQELVIAYIGLGSNLGDKAGYINSAMNKIANTEDVFVSNMSPIIETRPLGGKKQPDYFNCVVQVKTRLSPEKLLDVLQSIEGQLGRVRSGETNSSRTIDLDILLYGDRVVDMPDLKIPHCQMHLRSFVLNGICEIDENVIHPVLNETVKILRDRLNGQDFVIDPEKPKLVSIAGVVGVGKTTLARGLAVMTDGQLIEENYDDNPYLSQVYAGKVEYALKSELYFVNSSAEQLNHSNLETGHIYVSDYVFEKAFVYANRWLDQQHLVEYKQEYSKLEKQVIDASIVINMKDDLKRCLERIKIRQRPYEQEIGIEFLANLQSDYDDLFQSWKKCPVITVDCRNFNATDGESVRKLAQEIEMYI